MGIIERYNKFVKPAFEEYIKPQRKFADIIVPHGAHNIVAIELIKENLQNQLSKRINFDKKIKQNFEFFQHDIFDSKTFSNEKVKIINDSNLILNLKGILEDILNSTRPNYKR